MQLGWIWVVRRVLISTHPGPPHGWAVRRPCRASTSRPPLDSPRARLAFGWGSKPPSRAALAPVESPPGPLTPCPFHRLFILETAGLLKARKRTESSWFWIWTLESIGLQSPKQVGLLLGWTRTPGSKANRTPPWTRTPGSKANRTPPWTRTPGSKANRTPPWTHSKNYRETPPQRPTADLVMAFHMPYAFGMIRSTSTFAEKRH
jgi:hypothetical protein